jgi:hypothetical protein
MGPPTRRSPPMRTLRRPGSKEIIKAITHKSSAKTAGLVSRLFNAWALCIFARLIKPEKLAWMFDHPIDWTPPLATQPVGWLQGRPAAQE